MEINQINFYETEGGNKPVENFLDNLNSKAAQKITWIMRLIEERRGNVPKNYFEKLKHTDGIWEIKAKCGNNEYRILGFIDERNNTLFLVHGFQKKSQKTPEKDIDTAEIRRKDHLRRFPE